VWGIVGVMGIKERSFRARAVWVIIDSTSVTLASLDRPRELSCKNFVTIFVLIDNSKLGISIGPIDVLPWLHETGRLWSIFQNSRRSRESLQNTTCELLQIRIGTPPSLLRRSTSTPGSQFSLGRLETVSVVWVLCGRECCVCGCCECCVWVLRGYCCECCVWV